MVESARQTRKVYSPLGRTGGTGGEHSFLHRSLDHTHFINLRIQPHLEPGLKSFAMFSGIPFPDLPRPLSLPQEPPSQPLIEHPGSISKTSSTTLSASMIAFFSCLVKLVQD